MSNPAKGRFSPFMWLEKRGNSAQMGTGGRYHGVQHRSLNERLPEWQKLISRETIYSSIGQLNKHSRHGPLSGTRRTSPLSLTKLRSMKAARNGKCSGSLVSPP